MKFRLWGPKLGGTLPESMTLDWKRFLIFFGEISVKEESGSRTSEKLWREMFTCYTREPALNPWS